MDVLDAILCTPGLRNPKSLIGRSIREPKPVFLWMDPDGHLPTVRGKTFQKTALPSINSARYSLGGRDVQSPMVSYLQLRSSRYKGRAKPFKQLSRHYSVDGKVLFIHYLSTF